MRDDKLLSACKLDDPRNHDDSRLIKTTTRACRRALERQFTCTQDAQFAARTRVCVCGRASGNGRCEEDIYAKGGEGRDAERPSWKKGLRRGGVQGQERRDKERTDETTGAGEKEITAGSDRVVEINVARLIGATEECACGLSGSQPVFSVCLLSLGHVQ